MAKVRSCSEGVTTRSPPVSPSLAVPDPVVLSPLHYLQCLEGSHVAPFLGKVVSYRLSQARRISMPMTLRSSPSALILDTFLVFLIHEGHEDKTGSESPKVGPME